MISALTTKQTGDASGVGQPSAPPLQSTNCPHLWEPPKQLGRNETCNWNPSTHSSFCAHFPHHPSSIAGQPPLVHIGTGHSSPRADPEHSASLPPSPRPRPSSYFHPQVSPSCDARSPGKMARVYADVNQSMPRSYWDYDSVNISQSACRGRGVLLFND